jgi:crotonobetainyl-CoA:carnitine CoA-transferase CaiB-like acyl-CoA transferase
MIALAQALAGLRVLDLSRYVAGPHGTMLLGDHGADVVKVEPPGRGDPARGIDRLMGPPDSLFSMTLNRNKRSLALDLRKPEGLAILTDLAARADLMVENFRPGTLEAMGLDYATLSARNPRLILVRISGFGQDGPWAERPAYDAIAQAASGLMDMTGAPDGTPVMVGTIVIDYTTALHAMLGAMIALAARERTGLGQEVQASLLDGMASMLMTAVPEALTLGRQPTRHGNRDRLIAPSNTFRTSDGEWVHLMTVTDDQFDRLARRMGRADLLEDPRFATTLPRMRHCEAIEAITAEWVASLPLADVLTALREAGIPSSKVTTVAEMATSEHMQARRRIVEIEHPVSGRAKVAAHPLRFSATPPADGGRVPAVGEHSDAVLKDWLALSDGDIDALRRSGAVG